MGAYNHNLVYRPLLGGIAILNPEVNQVGTVGVICTGNGQDQWLLSCYHVLCRVDFSPFSSSEPIFQPIDEGPVAFTSIAKASIEIDCAAARLNEGVEGTSAILGISEIAGLGIPKVGMRVIKSGCVTGVTEGVITEVDHPRVVIAAPNNFDPSYELSREGDSGAIWIDSETNRAVALHQQGRAVGKRLAFATDLSVVLSRLQLNLLDS